MSLKPYNTDRLIVDFKKLPHEVNKTATKTEVLLTLGFGLFWSAISITLFFAFLNDNNEGLAGTIAVFSLLSCFVLIGLAATAFAIHLLTSQKIITFHKNYVEIYSKTLLGGKKNQTIPYNQFKGVLMGSYVLRQKNEASKHFQTIELIHDDKRLNQELYKVESRTPARDVWKGYIEQLRVPGLQKDGKGFFILQHDELDMSLQERSKKQYSTAADTDFSKQEVPSEFSIQKDRNGQGVDQLQIQILADRMSLSVKAIFMIIPVIFICLPLFDSGVPFVFPIFGALFLLIIGGMAIHDMRNKRQLKISRTSISIIDAMPQGKHNNSVKKIPLSQIENILIKGQAMNEHIVIIGKKGEINIGPGLPVKTLEWLQNYLRSAVVTA